MTFLTYLVPTKWLTKARTQQTDEKLRGTNPSIQIPALHSHISHSFTSFTPQCTQSGNHLALTHFLSLWLSVLLSLSPLFLLCLVLPPSNFLSLSSLFPQSHALHFVLSLLSSPLLGTARASVALCGTLAGHSDSSLLGKGSETFCKWGEMYPLVSNLVALVSGLSLRRVQQGDYFPATKKMAAERWKILEISLYSQEREGVRSHLIYRFSH